tara:strand:+ start:17215 stop:18582 length:1368 start_codon:yes stop_codon:yes gene_type:complete
MTNIDDLKELGKILKEFINDLFNTFNDKLENKLNDDLLTIKTTDTSKIVLYSDVIIDDIPDDSVKLFYIAIEKLDTYIKNLYPKHFFNILYQNKDIFDNLDEDTEFLPGIDFKELFFDTTTQSTRETIWKYLQSILFNSIRSLNDVDCFGDTAELFKAVDSDNFKDKLETVVNDINTMFNVNDLSNIDLSNNFSVNDNSLNFQNFSENFKDMFNQFDNSGTQSAEELHKHINNLINGKIGCIAKELAEETAKDLDIDENTTNPDDIFKKLIQNPTQLMSIVKNIGNKLDKKMKDGSINQSELIEEASKIFKDMKSMPGMGNIESLMKSMNLQGMMPPGAKIDKNRFERVMEDNLKKAKMRERMQKKAEKNKLVNNIDNLSSKIDKGIDLDTCDINKLNDNLETLLAYINNTSTSNNSIVNASNANNNSASTSIANNANSDSINTPRKNNKKKKKK